MTICHSHEKAAHKYVDEIDTRLLKGLARTNSLAYFVSLSVTYSQSYETFFLLQSTNEEEAKKLQRLSLTGLSSKV
jgi:hypothetical protein